MKPRTRPLFLIATLAGFLAFAGVQAGGRDQTRAPAPTGTLAQAMFGAGADGNGAQAHEQRTTGFSRSDLFTLGNQPGNNPGNASPCGLKVAAGERDNCGRDDRPISRR